jgi:hypothetical protein
MRRPRNASPAGGNRCPAIRAVVTIPAALVAWRASAGAFASAGGTSFIGGGGLYCASIGKHRAGALVAASYSPFAVSG